MQKCTLTTSWCYMYIESNCVEMRNENIFGIKHLQSGKYEAALLCIWCFTFFILLQSNNRRYLQAQHLRIYLIGTLKLSGSVKKKCALTWKSSILISSRKLCWTVISYLIILCYITSISVFLVLFCADRGNVAFILACDSSLIFISLW